MKRWPVRSVFIALAGLAFGSTGPSQASASAVVGNADKDEAPFAILGDTTDPGFPITDVEPVILAGAVSIVGIDGYPTDSPDNRVDSNTVDSPFAGVGSLGVGGVFWASAVVIGQRHVLTAGHAVDVDNDGEIDVSPESMEFHLNFGGDSTHIIGVSAITIHPEFTGFVNPALNDDIAIITLSSDIPAGVPIYQLHDRPMQQGDVLTLVGYGRSGWGDLGFRPPWENFNDKRVGRNVADISFLDDEGRSFSEVYVFDFDGPDETTNIVGGPTLGNDIETTLGFGDSGGPAFILDDGEYKLAGINTFIAKFIGQPASPPRFGSAGGGVMVFTAAAWVASEAGIPWTVNALNLNVQGDPAYLQPGEAVVIDMDVSNLAQPVNGCQAFLNYSSVYFRTDTVGIEAGGGVWDELIWSQADIPQPGDLDVAVGVELGAVAGTQADGTVAVFTLTVDPDAPDGETEMVFRPDRLYYWPDEDDTMLAGLNGETIGPTTSDSQTIVIDGTAPSIDITSATQGGDELLISLGSTINAVQGGVTIAVAASDVLAGLDGIPTVTVTPNGASAEDITATGVDHGDGTFTYTYTVAAGTPNGIATIDASVSDKSGNSNSDSDTFNINKNQITGQIESEGFVGASRAVTFVSTGTGNSKTWTITVDRFGQDGNVPAVSNFTLTDVPDGSTHVSAKTAWNLRSKVALADLGAGQATADLTGTDMLPGGDLNGSNFVNILDYSVLANHYGPNSDPVADINGSGAVNIADYSLLAANYFRPGDEE